MFRSSGMMPECRRSTTMLLLIVPCATADRSCSCSRRCCSCCLAICGTTGNCKTEEGLSGDDDEEGPVCFTDRVIVGEENGSASMGAARVAMGLGTGIGMGMAVEVEMILALDTVVGRLRETRRKSSMRRV